MQRQQSKTACDKIYIYFVPIVEAEFGAKVPFSNRVAKQVFPTPDSPKNTTEAVISEHLSNIVHRMKKCATFYRPN
jgi:hypothetical protein